MKFIDIFHKAASFSKAAAKDYTVHTIHYPDGPKYYGRVINPETGRLKKSPEYDTKSEAASWCDKFEARYNAADDMNFADFDWDQYQGKKPKPAASKKIDPYTGLPIEMQSKRFEEEATQPQLPAVPNVSAPQNNKHTSPFSIMNSLYGKLDGFSSPRLVNVDLDRSMLITTFIMHGHENDAKRLLKEVSINTISQELGSPSFIGPEGKRFFWNINGNIDNVDTTHAMRVVARITYYPHEVRVIILFKHDFYKKE